MLKVKATGTVNKVEQRVALAVSRAQDKVIITITVHREPVPESTPPLGMWSQQSCQIAVALKAP